jgi:hypothetical protein
VIACGIAVAKMLTLTVTVKSKDLGFDKIMRRASRFKRGVTTTAGIQGTKAIAKKPKHGGKSSTSLSRVTNVQAAFWNEYGAPGANPPIPQRSFLRSTYDEKENKYFKLFGIALVKSLFASSRKGMIKEINDVGDEYIRDVQKAIFARISPPNTLSTLSKKSRRAARIIKDVKSKFGHKKTVRQ